MDDDHKNEPRADSLKKTMNLEKKLMNWKILL